MQIRKEKDEDAPQIRKLLKDAFSGDAEANLVDELRRDGDIELSLVAVNDVDEVVGSVVFSRMSEAPFRALGLAPVAVRADSRRKGIAADLIREGLRLAKESVWHAAFVLGDNRYYGRFGFDAELCAKFECAYAGPHLMAMSLAPDGKLSTNVGKVTYAAAFGRME